MLVVIDPQNTYLDPKGEQYLSGGEDFVPHLQQRIKQALADEEYILYTRDIPIENKNEDEDDWQLQVVAALKPWLTSATELKKYFYALPPERLLELRHAKTGQEWWAEIEVCGSETQICVLANLLGLQSVFPEADFVVDRRYLFSSDQQKAQATLDLLAEFGVQIK
ncbi:isochorismatase family protein [Enterococcus sp. CSURQ0835]|uniref:isochorismatase family protein n=1 Tax=Enterococcus sp. CSURQ0835 TaxID=2681394 RepID=UPI00135AEF0A|nr:isochorismatase family protein [Enterococcus sp. CSURQ0835]